VTDAAQGVASMRNSASISSVTITGCAVSEMMHIRLQRDASHASDTLAATAEFVGMEFTYRRAM
jgi:hypothetical protein